MENAHSQKRFAIGERIQWRRGDLSVKGTIEAIAPTEDGEPGALTLLTDDLEWVVLRLTESAAVEPRYPTLH